MRIALLLLTFLFMGQRFKSTENTGMGKLNRIDYNEERLIGLKKEVNALDQKLRDINNQKLKQEISDLRQKVQSLQQKQKDFDEKLLKLNQRLDDLNKKGQPTPY